MSDRNCSNLACTHRLELATLLCLAGQEIAPTIQRPLLKGNLGANDYVGGATCWSSNCLYNGILLIIKGTSGFTSNTLLIP